MQKPSLADISDRSDDETYLTSPPPSELRSGFYRISTFHGFPLGRGKVSEYDPSLVVALPRHTPGPKWYIQKNETGNYVVVIDDLRVYFEQMALRINREYEEDRGIEWSIEPYPGEPWVFKFKNATFGPYRGSFEDVWIAPNVKSEDGYKDAPQVRVGDIEEVSDTAFLFKVTPA